MFDQLMALQWVKDNIEQFGKKKNLKIFSQGDQLQLKRMLIFSLSGNGK